MKSNQQILARTTDMLDQLRSNSSRIEALESLRGTTLGGNQRSLHITNGEAEVEIAFHQTEVKSHYKLAMTFIRKGINEEIDFLEAKNEELKDSINNTKVI